MEVARVDLRGQQVVRHRDSVNVAREVKIELLHRYDLSITTASSAALDSEGRSLAGLPQRAERVGVPVRGERLDEAEGRGALALAERRGRDASDDDVLAVLLVRQPLDHAQADLRLLAAIGAELVWQHADLVGQLGDGLGLVRPRDGDVTRYRTLHLQSERAHPPLVADEALGGALRRDHGVLH